MWDSFWWTIFRPGKIFFCYLRVSLPIINLSILHSDLSSSRQSGMILHVSELLVTAIVPISKAVLSSLLNVRDLGTPQDDVAR
jgi:hypothetical protein